MVGENWQEMTEFLTSEAWNAFQQLEPSAGDIAVMLKALRRDLPEVSEYVIVTLLSLGWQHFLVWLSDAPNRERLADFVSRTGEPWLAWWIEDSPSAAPDRPPPPFDSL